MMLSNRQLKLPDEGPDNHHASGSTTSHPNRPHRGSSLRTVDSQVIIDTDVPPSNALPRPSTSHSRNPSDSATAAASPSQPPPHAGNPSHPNPDLAKPTGNLKADSAPPAAPTQADPWYKNWSSILSLELKNTGSVARDHLASERTFLAWMRTSISLAMAGVAVAQLFALSSRSSQSSSSSLSSQLPHVPANLDLIPPSPSDSSSNEQHVFSASTPLLSELDLQTQAQIELINSVNRYYAALAAEVEARDKIRRFGKPLGGLFIGAAVVVMLIGVYRYFLTQHLLTKNQFSATRLPVFLLSALVGAIAVIVFGCLLAGYR